MIDWVNKIKELLVGSGEFQKENTATGYKYNWKQTKPNLLQRIMPTISSYTNRPDITNTPTAVPQTPESPPPQVAPAPPTTNSIQNEYAAPPTQTGYETARNPNITKYKVSNDVATALARAAEKYGIPVSLLYDIALQESSFDPYKTNVTPEGQEAGVPKGLFQFTPDTVETVRGYASNPEATIELPENLDLFDPYTNAMMAAYLIKQGQLGRWNASQNVWGPYYSQEELSPYYSQTSQEYIPTENWRR